MVACVFDEPAEYFKQLVTLAIDESGGGAAVLAEVIKVFNGRLPFLVLYDYHKA